MRFRSFFLVVALIACTLYGRAQDKLRTELFGDVDQTFSQAKEKHADLLSPTNYRKGLDYYNDATNLFSQGKNLEDIREKLKDASAYFAKALDNSYAGE